MTNVEQAYTFEEGMDTLPTDLTMLSSIPEQLKHLSHSDLLKKICADRMKALRFAGKQEYEDRLERELEVILGKNFAVYFLVIYDIMRFCRENGIVYGVGRGSACGSLVSYLLRITGIDPLEYNLLFERFLDESRSDLPDIDIDIQDNRRSEVKRYIERTYGEDHVAGIATYGYYQIASAFLSAARVLGVPVSKTNDIEVNSISDISGQLEAEYPGLKKLTESLMGKLANTGRHAAGIVVADKPLIEYASIESRSVPNGGDREVVVAMDKKRTEAVGLVKIDLLGLSTLSVVDDAIRIAKDSGEMKVALDWKNLKQDDERVFKMLSDGHTASVFQAEQSASTNLLRKMRVGDFTQLYTSNALVRSGAWNAFGDDYIDVLNGKTEPHYPTKDSKSFLEDTLSFPVFQEQSMLLCQEVAGLSVVDSNAIRRLTSKKEDPKKLAPYKSIFIDGCIKNGVPSEEAKRLWHDIEITSEYQFNKCLVGDTMVETKQHGEISIKSLFDFWEENPGAEVMVKGPSSVSNRVVGEPTWHKVKDVMYNGNQPTVRVRVSSDEYIDSTYHHKHRLSKTWKQAGRIWQNDRICTIDGNKTIYDRRYNGYHDVYDIELETEPHAFYANGFVTHNSHAVAYSLLTYASAYLKYHYPGPWMTAVLKHETNPGKISTYLAECKRLGLKVQVPHVNKTEVDYSYKDGDIYMGMASVKYISDKSAEKIIAHRPYRSFEHFKEIVFQKGSGVNTRMMSSLNLIGALEFEDNPIDERECKKNYFEYLGIPSFDDIAVTDNMQKKLTSIADFSEKKIQVIMGVVSEIVSGGTWFRANVVDNDGTAAFFMNSADQLKKGNRYMCLVAENSLVDSVDLSDFGDNDSKHPIMRWINGEMDDGTYIIGGTFRQTKKGKEMVTAVYSHNGRLGKFMAIGDKVEEFKRTCKRGSKLVRLRLSEDGVWFNGARV